MDLSKQSIKNVGRYFALQYLSDQRGALRRVSWSWRRSRFAIGKGWNFMKRAFRFVRYNANQVRKGDSTVSEVTFQDLLIAWGRDCFEGVYVVSRGSKFMLEFCFWCRLWRIVKFCELF